MQQKTLSLLQFQKKFRTEKACQKQQRNKSHSSPGAQPLIYLSQANHARGSAKRQRS
jgi:hypothetical protein